MDRWIVEKLGMTIVVGKRRVRVLALERPDWYHEMKAQISKDDFFLLLGDRELSGISESGYVGDGERDRTHELPAAEWPDPEGSDRPYKITAQWRRSKAADRECAMCKALGYTDEMPELGTRATLVGRATYMHVCKACYDTLAGRHATCAACGLDLEVDGANYADRWEAERHGWPVGCLTHQECYRKAYATWRAEQDAKVKAEQDAKVKAEEVA